MTTDEQLIIEIKNGDLKAIEILFDRYYTQLCGFAYKIIKDKDLAKDIVSDIYVKIWTKNRLLNISSSVRAYLYISVRNQAINILKSQKKVSRLFTNMDDQNSDEIGHEAEFVEVLESEDEVKNILRHLTERKRLIFQLKIVDGLKYKEIAEILSISVNTVQNHMVEAMKILAKKYPKN